jgi:predicted transposase YbfD/YdcC|tara:strand:+ start:221 stop:1318 length:1098 start_codon:yes stop_codon:yes gene_type:complete
MKNKNIIGLLSKMEDHRIERRKEHLLTDIIIITMSAVICGAENWNQIEMFGKSKQDWFKTFLELPNGIPSHDTFNRFFTALDPDKFENVFREWVKSISKKITNEVISIDGKTIRGAKEHGNTSPIHMVSAWANSNNLVLGQLKVKEKSNEITAIPELLDAIFIKDCIITIDAMGCQVTIAEKVIKEGGDYILAVKGNQKTLQQNIEDSFRFFKAGDVSESLDADHGRVEQRTCSVIKNLEHIENSKDWKGIKTIIKIDSIRYFKSTKKQETSTRLYISSLDVSAEKFQEYIRSHWGIENKLHWCLDVAFREDASRKRAGDSAQNFSAINKIALTMLKRDTLKASIMTKRLNAGWNESYLKKILEF